VRGRPDCVVDDARQAHHDAVRTITALAVIGAGAILLG
jgi:hypothetical protein